MPASGANIAPPWYGSMAQCRWELALAAMTPDDIALAGMTPDDLASLQRAVQSLEHPGLAARLTNMVGKPIELIGYALPASVSDAIATATSKALDIALNVALGSIQRAPARRRGAFTRPWLRHRGPRGAPSA